MAAHVLAVCVLALPSPGPVLPGTWNDPTVQDEIGRWGALLGRSGTELDGPLFELASGYESIARTVRAPFELYGAAVGVSQRWQMFAAPHRYPSRLEVEGHVDGVWVPLFVAGEEIDEGGELAGLGRVLAHPLMRSAWFRYAWDGARDGYDGLAAWIGRRVTAARPDVRAVRVSYRRLRTPTPSEFSGGAVAPAELHRVRLMRPSRELP